MKRCEIIANDALRVKGVKKVSMGAFAGLVESLPEGVFDGYRDALIGIHQRLFPHRREGSLKKVEKWLELVQADEGARGIFRIDANRGPRFGVDYAASVGSSRVLMCPADKVNLPLQEPSELIENILRRMVKADITPLTPWEFRVAIVKGTEVIVHPAVEGYAYNIKFYTDALAGFDYPEIGIITLELLPLLYITGRSGKIATIAPILLDRLEVEEA